MAVSTEACGLWAPADFHSSFQQEFFIQKYAPATESDDQEKPVFQTEAIYGQEIPSTRAMKAPVISMQEWKSLERIPFERDIEGPMATRLLLTSFSLKGAKIRIHPNWQHRHSGYRLNGGFFSPGKSLLAITSPQAEAFSIHVQNFLLSNNVKGGSFSNGLVLSHTRRYKMCLKKMTRSKQCQECVIAENF